MGTLDVVEVAFRYLSAAGQEFINVRHYEQTTADDFDPVTLDQFAANVVAEIVGPSLNCISTSVSFDRTVATVLTGPAAGLQVINTDHNGDNGNSGGTPGPVERAIIFSLRTGFAGRRNRGRMYLPQPSEEIFDAQGNYIPANVDAADIGLLSADLLTGVDGFGTGDMLPCVYHRDLQIGGRIINVLISPVCGTQRRRKLGVGS